MNWLEQPPIVVAAGLAMGWNLSALLFTEVNNGVREFTRTFGIKKMLQHQGFSEAEILRHTSRIVMPQKFMFGCAPRCECCASLGYVPPPESYPAQ